MSAHGLLNLTCTISRPTQGVSTTDGHITWSYADILTGVPCSAQITGPREDQLAAREVGRHDGVVYLPYGTDVRVQDRITDITGPYGVGHPGVVFEVSGPPTDDSGRGAYYRVPVRHAGGSDST